MSSDGTSIVRSTAVAGLAAVSIIVFSGVPATGQVLPPDEVELQLDEARSGHTATLLSDAHVLLAGGSDGQTELASVEVVDPVGMTVEALGSLVAARSGHTATLLPDGTILVAGGRIGDASLGDAEVLDPLSGSSEPTGSMQWARADHDAVPLPDGRVLVIGGSDGGEPVVRAELFDPATGTFAKAAKSKATHIDPAVALLPAGRVLVSGTASRKKGKPAELYDPARNKWSAIRKAPKLSGHSATALPDGRILLAGGADAAAVIYDPARGTFGRAGTTAGPRSGLTATALLDGRVLLLGGAEGELEVPTIEVFDPSAGAFGTIGELFVPRLGHTATLLPDGRVLVAGGSFAGITLDDLSVFDPADDSLLSLGSDAGIDVDTDEEVAGSRTKADIRARYGPPEAFAILYFDEAAPDGSVQAVSLERWSYYGAGLEFTFSDGGVVAEDAVELEVGAQAEPVPYDPDRFSAYMSLEEVVSASGLEDFIGGSVDEMVENGELYFGDRLAWGIKDGELRYIEALALEATDTAEEGE